MRRSPLAALLLAIPLAGCGAQSPVLPGSLPLSSHGPGSSAAPVGNVARGPYLQHADSGVTVAWYSEHPSDGRVLWVSDDGRSGEVPSSAGHGTRHEAVIDALRPGVRYTYRVASGSGPLAGIGGRLDYEFRVPQPDVLRVVVFGDSGVGGRTQQAVADAIAREPVAPDLVMIAGDVMQPPGTEDQYVPKFFAPYQALLPAIPFYAAVGNHDDEVDGGQPLYDTFSLPRNGPPGLHPESTYFLERAGVQVVVHDSNRSAAQLREHAAPWHRQVTRRPAVFRLAVQHHTLYSSGPNAKPPARSLLTELYSSTGIDVVFNGHDHFYERTRPLDGVVYVTTGGGGGSLYARVAQNPFTAAFVNDRHSYTFLEVQGRTLQARQMDTDGRVIDSFTLTKPVASGDSVGSASPPAFAGTVQRRFRVAGAAALEAAFLRVSADCPWSARLNGGELTRTSAQAGDGGRIELPLWLIADGENVVEARCSGPAALAPELEVSLLQR